MAPVALQLYDTRTRSVRPFEPLRAGEAGLYVCGPTVQSGPHVGHLRVAVAFDILRRWLTTSGYAVTLVRNVTDIDDKIIANARAAGTTPWALAERYTREFNAAYDAVGVLPPTVEPRATAHVPEMVALMRRLVDAGAGYESGGSVWFSVASLPSYGTLSGQRPDAVQPSPEADAGKRDPRDFALWKAARPGEPTWDTPWGPGRPGWHLECSAMAGKYLGEQFDIHGAGIDLVFPHHENERAQTVRAAEAAGACGETAEMARWWVHAGLLTTAGEKMSKSVGNVFLAADALAAARPQVLRYALASAHYRSGLEYGPDTLVEAASAYERLETFVRSVPGEPGVDEPAAVWDQFAAAMDDDLAVSRALAVVFGAVGSGNRASDAERAGWGGVVRRMLAVLGLDPVSQWPAADAALGPVLDAVVQVALDARSHARAQKDYAASDAIRDRLAAAGVVVEDAAGGQRWHLAVR